MSGAGAWNSSAAWRPRRQVLLWGGLGFRVWGLGFGDSWTLGYYMSYSLNSLKGVIEGIT